MFGKRMILSTRNDEPVVSVRKKRKAAIFSGIGGDADIRLAESDKFNNFGRGSLLKADAGLGHFCKEGGNLLRQEINACAVVRRDADEAGLS